MARRQEVMFSNQYNLEASGSYHILGKSHTAWQGMNRLRHSTQFLLSAFLSSDIPIGVFLTVKLCAWSKEQEGSNCIGWALDYRLRLSDRSLRGVTVIRFWVFCLLPSLV